MTHPLIQKLQRIRKSIESIFEEPCEQVDLNYFYFAPIHERLAIHREEKRRGIDRLVPYQEKIQGDILEFKPYFELKLAEKGIHSIADRNLPWDFEWDGHF
ncbi:MAG: hypothetical protein JSS09_03625, partial [Verrucomicrobia bacterium]|nr:hypothetical protein [Verrucomicrobiota bacterium]